MVISKIVGLLCLLSVCSCALPNRFPANIFIDDDRIAIPREQRVNIGSIHNKRTWDSITGTAFHIDACHVVTSYHLIQDTREKMSRDDFVFFSHTEKEGFIKAKPIAYGTPYLLDEVDHGLEDWVVLRLEKCRDVKGLVVKELSFIELQNKKLKLLGFPRDRNFDDISVDPECKVGHEPNPLYKGIPHDCAVKQGNSGGPLIATIDGVEVVVGIQSFKRRGFEEPFSEYASSWANMATPVKMLASAIKKIKAL